MKSAARRRKHHAERLGVESLERRQVLATFVSGQFGWAAGLEPGPGADPAWVPSAVFTRSATAVDASGNVYVTGVAYGSVDFDPSAGSSPSTVGSLFIAKYSPAGALRWARQVDTSLRQDPSIAITSAGDVVVAGSFERTSDFDPGPAVRTLTPTGYIDGFVMCLTASGGYRWAKRFGGEGWGSETYFKHVLADSSGGIYVAGNFNGLTNLGLAAGYRDAVLLKLDGAGTRVWSRQVGAVNAWATGLSVERDAAGGVYLAGNYTGSVDLDPGAGVVMSPSTEGSRAFLVRLGAAGGYSRSLTMPADAGLEINDIEVAPDGGIYVGGSYDGIIDLGQVFGPPASGVTLASAGEGDGWLVKLSSAGRYEWVWKFGYVGHDSVSRIVTSSTGAVFVGGQFSGDVDFDRGPGRAVLNPVTWYVPSAFILRMNAAGTFVTVRRYGCESSTPAAVGSMAVTPGGAVYWTGTAGEAMNTGGISVDPDGGGAVLQRAVVNGQQPPVGHFLAKEVFAPGVFIEDGYPIDGVQLGSTSLGYAVRRYEGQYLTPGPVIPVTVSGQSASRTNPGGGWLALGARPAGQGFELLWRNTQTGGYAAWVLDAAGRQTSWRLLTLGDVYSIEKQHSIDITGEGRVGAPVLPFTLQRKLGITEFGTTAAGYALRVNTRVVQISFAGGYAAATRPGGGLVARAARRVDTGFEVLWRNAQVGGWSAWTLDANGAKTGERSVRLVDVYALEKQFSADITGDGRIGAPA